LRSCKYFRITLELNELELILVVVVDEQFDEDDDEEEEEEGDNCEGDAVFASTDSML
jgi:hypothetical protein